MPPCAGKPMRLLVQAVGAPGAASSTTGPGRRDEARQGRLVVIAEHDDIDAGAIRWRWRAERDGTGGCAL